MEDVQLNPRKDALKQSDTQRTLWFSLCAVVGFRRSAVQWFGNGSWLIESVAGTCGSSCE